MGTEPCGPHGSVPMCAPSPRPPAARFRPSTADRGRHPHAPGARRAATAGARHPAGPPDPRELPHRPAPHGAVTPRTPAPTATGPHIAAGEFRAVSPPSTPATVQALSGGAPLTYAAEPRGPPRRRTTPRQSHPAADLPRPRTAHPRTPRSRPPPRQEPPGAVRSRAGRWTGGPLARRRPDGRVTGQVVQPRRTTPRRPAHTPDFAWPESCAAIGSGQDGEGRSAVGGGAEPKPDREARGDFQPLDIMLNLQALVRFP